MNTSINTSLFPAKSGDYSAITQVITVDDAIAFNAIYNELNAHAIATENNIFDYLSQGVCIAMSDYEIAAISTLKAVGLIQTNDNVHVGLTILGYGFYQFIKTP